MEDRMDWELVYTKLTCFQITKLDKVSVSNPFPYSSIEHMRHFQLRFSTLQAKYCRIPILFARYRQTQGQVSDSSSYELKTSPSSYHFKRSTAPFSIYRPKPAFRICVRTIRTCHEL